jgi:hypothetical protein
VHHRRICHCSTSPVQEVNRDGPTYTKLQLTPLSAPPAPRPNGVSRTGTMPTQHRPARSQEDESRRRGPAPPRGPPRPPRENGLDIIAGASKVESSRRPRRNSESSILDSREEDRKRRERRKEREERREKEGRTKDGKAKPTRKPQGLDLIDKLDVTGIYGQGRECHVLELRSHSPKLTEALQFSTTTDLSMHATHTATVKRMFVPLCKHSPQIRPTTLWEDLVL